MIFPSNEYLKWRLTYKGGREFVDTYLEKISSREDTTLHEMRNRITYCPAYAKREVNKIRDHIASQLPFVKRKGSQKYLKFIGNNVDRSRRSMDMFTTQCLLPELLPMGMVGVYMDMADVSGKTLGEVYTKQPYIYLYEVEAIKEVRYDSDMNCQYLRTIDTHYQYIYESFGDFVSFSKKKGDQIIEAKDLQLPYIPFTFADIGGSLLEDAADYQIALMNLESSDLLYCLQSNFPFYTEPYDPKTQSSYLKVDPEAPESNDTRVTVGPVAGRRFPFQSSNAPAFIHPSSEPLMASMEKEEKIKNDIKELIGYKVDELGNGEGLTFVLQVLNKLENDLARFWSLYTKDEEGSVKYPEKFLIQKVQANKEEVNSLKEIRDKIPSLTARKEISKRIATITLVNYIPRETLDVIVKEIDSADYATSDIDELATDLEQGLISKELASEARGYPEGQVEMAREDHLERVKAIQQAQTVGAGARGIPDLSSDPNEGKIEKRVSQDSTKDPVPTDKTRGEAK